MCVRTCAAIVCTTSPGIRIHFPVVELFGCTMMRIFFFGCAAHCIGWEFSVSFKTSQQSPLNRSMRDKKEVRAPVHKGKRKGYMVHGLHLLQKPPKPSSLRENLQENHIGVNTMVLANAMISMIFCSYSLPILRQESRDGQRLSL